MISVDGSLFIQIANFLLLIWVLNKVLYKPIRNILQERKAKVEGLEQDIESRIKDADDKDKAYSAGIREARTNGLKEKDALIQVAEEEEKEIIAKINEKAQAELIKIRRKVAEDTEEVRISLLKEVDKFANEIGEKILGRAV